MEKPIIAIIGRPNVGKSTFFNRMLSQRQSIVDSQEGITRDRVYGDMEWCGKVLRFADTGGYIPNDIDQFNSAVRKQAQLAISESDLVLFMVDGKQGATSIDYTIAQFVRESGKPLILVVNKCDDYKSEQLIHEFYDLGLKEPIPISSLHGRRTGDLLDLIIKNIDFTFNKVNHNYVEDLRLAIVGMPNVGKSSLTNSLLQEERTIVTPIAGTTRDSVDVLVKWHGNRVTLVDTAGLRKLAKIKDKIEYYSTIRTSNAIKSSNVVLVLIDAEKGFGKQDKKIVDDVISKGKGMIIVINKWDLIHKETHTMNNFQEKITNQFKSLKHYPMLFISSKTKQRIHRVLELSWEIYKKGKKIIPTKDLNDYIKNILIKNPPPVENGKIIKIKYATQVSCEPMIIALYTNAQKKIKISYQRYLENQLRNQFNLSGIPIHLSFRSK